MHPEAASAREGVPPATERLRTGRSALPDQRTLLSWLFAGRLVVAVGILLGAGLVWTDRPQESFLSTIAVAVAVAGTLRRTFGVTTSTWSGTSVAVAFTLAGFVADDFTRYLVHLVMHRVPALWELHKVHHSAEVLTPFTLQRVHPLEGFFMAVRSTVTLGLVLGTVGGALVIPAGAAVNEMAIELIVEAFAVVVIGGLGSMRGALVGSLIVGVLKAVAIAVYPEAEMLAVYVIVIAVLLLRPAGLFARATA